MSPTDWASLHHAYGTAEDIPALLKAAENAPAPDRYDQEPWFSLWSALCHQEDVYLASYAAVPELVRIAASREGGPRAECLLLAGCIELERNTARAPSVPDWLIDTYRKAIAAGAEVAASSLRGVGPADDRRRFEIALAAFRGDLTTARRLLAEDEESKGER